MKRTEPQRGIRLSLFFLFFVIALCSIGIGIAAAEPVMSVIPSTTNVNVGGDFSVFIEVNPAGYTLQMARTNLTYDPSKVTILEVVDCETFEYMFNNGTIVDGVIPDIIGLSQTGVSSTGNLAEIRMHADNPGTFTVGLSDAGVGAEHEVPAPNVNNGTITIEEPVGDTAGPDIMFIEPPTPANATEVNVNYVNISVNMTDPSGVDNVTVILMWNETEYSMTEYMYAFTEGKYYCEMTNLENENYTYWVQANDTLGNPGVSEMRVVTVNVTGYSGDFTGDGYVNIEDVVYMVINLWGSCTPGAEGDFTGDGYVNIEDVVYMVINLWGSCS